MMYKSKIEKVFENLKQQRILREKAYGVDSERDKVDFDKTDILAMVVSAFLVFSPLIIILIVILILVF